MVLFGSPASQSAKETGAASERSLQRRAARFEAEGMESLFGSEAAKKRKRLPPSVRRLIVDLKAEHPALNPNEIAAICYVRFGRRPDRKTVKRVLAEEPVPLRMVRRFAPYHEIEEAVQRRRAVVALHAEGWSAKAIAGYLRVGTSTVYRTLKRWVEEGLARLLLRALRAGAGLAGLRPLQELAPVRGGGPGRQRGGAVAGLREPHARAPRRGARPLRGGGRGRHREAQGGGQAEALRGPGRAPAAKALRPRRPRGGRVAQGDEAGGLRSQGAARSAPAAAGPLPLRRGPPALTPTGVRGSRPEVGEPYGRLARSLGGDVLGELDDQPLGTADVDEPIDVRVVLDLADRVEPVVPQAVDDRVEVLDLDADVPEAGPVRRPGLRALVVGRRVVLDELQLAGAIGRPHHHHLRPDAGEPVDLVHRLALDRRPALALEPQADEERGRGVEVVHDDTHMIETQHPHIIHSLDVADRWGKCPLCR